MIQRISGYTLMIFLLKLCECANEYNHLNFFRVIRNISDSDFEILESSTRQTKLYQNHLCMQYSLPQRALEWGPCSYRDRQSQNDILKFRRKKRTLFIAERAIGIW